MHLSTYYCSVDLQHPNALAILDVDKCKLTDILVYKARQMMLWRLQIGALQYLWRVAARSLQSIAQTPLQ